MSAPAVPPLLPFLRTLPDPRQARGRRHPLAAILALSCAAMLAGCDSLLAIAEWGRDPAGGPLAPRLGFTRGAPACGDPAPCLQALDVAAFEHAVGAWAAAVDAACGTARGAAGGHRRQSPARQREPGVPAVRLLGALGHDLGLVLAEAPVPAGSVEAGPALPTLLADLVLAGRVLTFDAAFTERAVAEAIAQKGALPDGGQGQPAGVAVGSGAALRGGGPPGATGTARPVDKGHGRLEVRRLWTSAALVGYTDWPGLAQAPCLERQRRSEHRRGPPPTGLRRDQPAAGLADAGGAWRCGAATGGSRTGCTGCATSASTRTARRRGPSVCLRLAALTTPRSACCAPTATPPSPLPPAATCRARRRPPRPVSTK